MMIVIPDYGTYPGIKASGTVFDRFGIITTWIDGNGQRVYFDDLEYTFKCPMLSTR